MMKHFTSFSSHLSQGALLAILSLVFYGCASEPAHIKSNAAFQKNSSVFNDAFESKRSKGSKIFLPMEMKEVFMDQFREIKKRVTFDEVEIVKTEYFNDGVPLGSSSLGPDADFNEAEITLRYQVVVAPSNNLKTITAKQRWVKDGERWLVIPDLDPFLN